MSLDQRIRTWLGSISDTFEPLAPLERKRPYEETQSTIQKRHRTDSPTGETSSLNLQVHQFGVKRQRSVLGDGLHSRTGSEGRVLGRVASMPSLVPRPHDFSPLPKTYTQADYFSLQLLPNDLPLSLRNFMNKVDEIVRGDGILPNSERSWIRDTSKVSYYQDWNWAREGPLSERYFHDDRNKLGATPHMGIVNKILYQAQFCQTSGASQADWNIEVTQRILEASLRPLSGPGCSQLVDFRSSTTATIIPEYNTDTLRPRQTDFSIYIDPACDTDPQVSRQVHTFRQSLPRSTFNHVDLPTLHARPIALSVETLQDNTMGFAGLRKGVSMLPHYKFLQALTLKKCEASETRRNWELQNDAGMHADPEVRTATPRLLDFLPGIVIQGHKWHLVIAVPQGDKMGFYERISFGSTTSSKGIYQIICVLQLLQHWAREIYWPWLRNLLMKWPRRPGVGQ
ncbi:hypothetical protein FGRMN_145 [Fusarium graminum]|nr:hypothetical protein FGRMN_145 [Fusarium graminum]